MHQAPITKPSNYQMYFDANHLYGWAMSQSLPECGFAWVDEPESVDYMHVSDDSETGYILEVDLDYPAEIHDVHNDYPEQKTIPISDLSEHSQTLRKELGKKGKPNEKLIPQQEEKVCRPLQKLEMICLSWLESDQGASCDHVPTEQMVEEVHRFKHREEESGKKPFRERFLQIDEHCHFGKTMENVFSIKSPTQQTHSGWVHCSRTQQTAHV